MLGRRKQKKTENQVFKLFRGLFGYEVTASFFTSVPDASQIPHFYLSQVPNDLEKSIVGPSNLSQTPGPRSSLCSE